MKKLLYLLLAVTIIGCSNSEDEDNSNLTFFEKYDGVVWEVETFNNGMIPDKSVTNTRYKFLSDLNFELYRFEDDGSLDIIDDCSSRVFLETELSNISENSFTYKEGLAITVFTVTNNGNSLSLVTSSIGGGEPDMTDTYFRTSLNNPCP